MSVLGTRDALQRNNVTVSGAAAGRVMMFAHGFGCSKATWDLVAPHFETDHRVILFDHVGAGGSDVSAYDAGKYDSLHGYADDVLEILDALDVTDVVFVGHSVSAMIGILAANRDPSRFGALVLVGPSPRYVNDGSYQGGFESDDIASLLDSLDSNYLGWSQTMAPVIIGNPQRPELGEQLTTSFCSIDPDIARHFAHVTFLSDNRADLPLVTVPTLVMQCTADAIAPSEVGHYVHAAIDGSTLSVLEATGHVPILSAPDEVVAQIRGYLGDRT
ncbi:alpha/beta hydrolase [Microbacterium sp. QXD-8]|uniref:Alpha/beta hydrolase n=1 Tax=Microbacterium psychrotolerans TaxID=3068321 RepID=A0ABU0Z4R4_9MICO|nr:alpha/beta hydrolase [Microbacterium sp. QXD-8]MDQ7879527.1 alpha/beta hydrolase [Microbacterium sp. QXD-8]